VTSTNFDLGSDQRITRSTTALVDLTGTWTLYAKAKVVTYGSWLALFGAIEDTSNFMQFEADGSGDLHIGRQGPGIPYDEISIWSDGFTGWFDFLAIASGGTVQVYYRRDGGSWTTSVTRTMPNIAEAQIHSGFPDAFPSGDSNGVFRLAKLAVWTTNLAEATGKAEGDARTLGTSGSCIFYNECSGTAPNVDASGAGNNWTLVGSPTSNADDPWSAAGGTSDAVSANTRRVRRNTLLRM
jgi:hypothetical protein